MPIASTDVLVKLATTAGAAGNANTSTPAASLGKYISTTQLVDNNLHNLFNQADGTENAASASKYRCLFIHNNHATLSYTNIRIYLLSEVAGGAVLAIGGDATAASAIGAAGVQAVTIANEDTAPAGVAFTAPVSLVTGINIVDLTPGQCRAIWVRRTTANTAALANDGGTLRITGESL